MRKTFVRFSVWFYQIRDDKMSDSYYIFNSNFSTWPTILNEKVRHFLSESAAKLSSEAHRILSEDRSRWVLVDFDVSSIHYRPGQSFWSSDPSVSCGNLQETIRKLLGIPGRFLAIPVLYFRIRSEIAGKGTITSVWEYCIHEID